MVNDAGGRLSTSAHTLSGDTRKGRWLWPVWYGLNMWNNRSRRDDAEINKFHRENLDGNFPVSEKASSPSRRLTDLFLASLPWWKIAAQMGGDIRLADVGCGNGSYSAFYRQVCQCDGTFEYVGFDQRSYREWDGLRSDSVSFEVCSASEALIRTEKRINVIATISAVEHFTDDLVFFRSLRDYVRDCDYPVIQMHFVPSWACLWLYGVHGVRQYTPRTMRQIRELFSADGDSTLYYLGGPHCNRLHFTHITLPRKIGLGDLRFKKPDEYEHKLKNAILHDFDQQSGPPSFLALVVCSNTAGDFSLSL